MDQDPYDSDKDPDLSPKVGEGIQSKEEIKTKQVVVKGEANAVGMKDKCHPKENNREERPEMVSKALQTVMILLMLELIN